MSIENRYPALANKVAEAREAGYQDEEIESYLAEREQTALEEGYKQEDVDAFLGRVENQSTGVLDDVGRMFGMGLNQVAGAFGGVVEQAGKVTGLEGAEGAGKWIQDKTDSRAEELSRQLSWEQQQAREKKFTQNEEGERAWGEAWKDPRAYLGLVSESAPGTIVGIGVGGVLTRAASKVAPWLGRTGAAGLGYGAGEGIVAGTMAGKQVVDEIHNTPWETLVQTEEFRKAYHSIEDESMTHEDKMVFARSKIETAAYGEAAGKAGLVTAILSAPTGIAFDRMLRGAGLNKAAKPKSTDVLKYTAGEGLQEAPQGGSEEYISGTTLQKYADPSINPMDNVLEAAVSEGIAGVAMGAPTGVGSHAVGRSRYNQVKNRIGQLEKEIFSPAGEVNPDVTPDTVSEYLGLTGVSAELWNEAGRPVLSPYARNVEAEQPANEAPEAAQPEQTEPSREKLQKRIANIEKIPAKNRTAKQLENLTKYQEQLKAMESNADGMPEPSGDGFVLPPVAVERTGEQFVEPTSANSEEFSELEPQGAENTGISDSQNPAGEFNEQFTEQPETEGKGDRKFIPIMQRQEYRDILPGFVDNNVSTKQEMGMGAIMGADERGHFGTRAKSANPAWAQEAIAVAGSVAKLKNAVNKAARGEVLGENQRAAVEIVADAYSNERVAAGIEDAKQRRIDTQNNTRILKAAEDKPSSQFLEMDERESAIYAEFDEETKTLHELIAQAHDVADENTIDSLLESDRSDGEIAAELYRLIERGADGRQGQESESVNRPAEAAQEQTESEGAERGQKVTPEVEPTAQPKADVAIETRQRQRSESATPDFEEMVKEAARWRGAALNHASSLDKKGKYQVSKRTTKGDLDAYLMRKYGIDETEARDVSNALTQRNVEDDRTADPADYEGEEWQQIGNSVVPRQQDTPPVASDQTAETAQTDLPAERRTFIEGKVSGLGSVEAVDQLYSDDTPVDRYAREYARQVLEAGETESKPAQKTKAAETAAQEGKSAKESREDQETTQKPSANTIFTEDAAGEARRIIRESLSQTSAGFDPKLALAGLTLAGYHIEKGARTFAAYAKAMVEDMGDMVKPHLKSWYIAVKYEPSAAALHPDMDSAATVESAEIDDILKINGGENVTDERTPGSVERDSQDARTGDELGERDISPDGGVRDSSEGGEGVRSTAEQGGGPADSGSVSGRETPAPGKRGNQQAYPADGSVAAAQRTPGSNNGERGGDISFVGSAVDPVAAEAVGETATKGREKAETAKQQKQAERKRVKLADRDNIAETLPALYKEQQDDVYFAEQRFSKPKGTGVLFANGTGTGKTFTGLGIIKRFSMRGKDNVLIVVPNAKLIDDWIESGKALGLDIKKLKDTKDSGNGIVITTYANMGSNNSLAEREWDLVVPDEADNLMSNKGGKETSALATLRAITSSPRGTYDRFRMLYRDKIAERDQLAESMKSNRNLYALDDTTDMQRADLEEEYAKLKEEHDALVRELDKANNEVVDQIKNMPDEQRTRVAFLSATPIPYEKNVDYLEGYLFDYPEDGYIGNSRQGGFEKFMVENFGYRIRYHKLNEPDKEVNRGLMQRMFNKRLREEGVLSTRMLSVDKDYDRRFVLTENAIGSKIDDGLQFLWDNEQYRPLADIINKRFDYLSRRYLLEAIKARESVPLIKDHLSKGRKVVVFHDYKKGGGFNPFDLGTLRNSKEVIANTDMTLGDLVKQFEAERPDLQQIDFKGLNSPVATFSQAFDDELLIVNGDFKERENLESFKRFNDEDSGPVVMLVQSAKNSGWSGHDTTGKYQRVMFNLGLPERPTMAIQQEGRIYRVGQASNAIFRYLNTGTNWERIAFAQTIAQRSSTAENLAMGEEARALMDGFIEAFEESDSYPAGHPGEGTGGKERDAAANAALTEWDRAMSLYYSQLKRNSKSKAQEGLDYFATPEPLGLKMVEWADIRGGEDVLEPSAGHGAIARWIPENVEATIVEPSLELSSKVRMVAQGKHITDTFENLHKVNKYDAIVMNPPFGKGGKTAIEHLEKATSHLRDGGRVVAIIPTGPAADKRFDNWFYAEDEKGKSLTPDLSLRAEISLPSSTFERAGTSVKARIVVIDKGSESTETATRDYSNATDVKEFFERIEDSSIPERTKAEPVEETIAPQAEGSESGFKLAQTTHAKKGIDLYVATNIERVPYEEYKRLNSIAKKNNGYYSKFNRNGAVPGFQFESEQDRAEFLREAGQEQLQSRSAPKTNNTPAQVEKEAKAFLGKGFEKMKQAGTLKVVQSLDEAPEGGLNSRNTDSKEFKQWFGDSKVVDEDGEPLVVYHGTPDISKLTEFNPALAGKSTMAPNTVSGTFYFTTDTDIANMFTVAGAIGGEPSPYSGIAPVYLSIRKPYVIDAAEWAELNVPAEAYWAALEDAKELLEQHMEGYLDTDLLTGEILSEDGIPDTPDAQEALVAYSDLVSGGIESLQNTPDFWEDYFNDIKQQGFDGVHVVADGYQERVPEADADMFIAFSPTQIKSVNNRGTFDPADPNILHSKSGDIAGVYKDGTITLVADQIAEGETAGLLKHEGLHLLLRNDPTFKKRKGEIMRQFKNLKNTPKVREAYSSVPEDTAANVRDEEALAYLVQNHKGHSLVKRMISAVKAWMFRNGIPVTKLTEGDLTALAAQGIKRFSKAQTTEQALAQADAMVGSEQPVFSRKRKPGPVESRLFDTQEHKAWYSAVQGAFSRGNFSKDKIAEILDNANTAVLDRLNPVKKNLGEHVYRLHRLMGNSHATMQTFLEHGELSWKDQALTVLTKDKGFLPWLERLGDDAPRLFKWMAVRRAAILDRQGRENWLTADQRKALLDELFEGLTPEQRRAKVARFEQLNKEFQKWNKNIIKIAREAGLISEEQIEAWTSDYYLPFYRIMENEMTGEEFMRAPRKAKQHVSAQIRRLKGGKEKLGDPIENIMRNWSHLIQASQANVARQAAADVAVDIGVAEEVSKAELTNILGTHTTRQWAVRGAGNTRATKIFDDPATAEVYRETMEGRTGRAYEVVEQKNTTVQFGNQRDFSIVSYQDNGETVYLRVNDPDLFEAMSEVNIKAFESTTMKIMGLSKRVLTVGATATAGFRIANLFRDTIHTAMVSKSFIPFLDSAKGLAEVWNKSDAYIELMASGGGFSQGWVDSGDPKAMARAMEKIVKRKGEGSKGIILDTPRKMWEFWERIGHASEMAARVQLYKNLKAKGQSHMDAAFEARDLMDFQRSGASTSVRVLTATVPFLNARFQGLNRMYRGAKADPKAFWTKGAITAGASLMLWSLFKDDERYKELEDWEKFAYHHFWIGEQHFRLPKAFETGALFSTMFEAGADVMSGNEEFGYFVDFLTHTTTETFAIGMPQLISPVMEVYSNKSAFTGRDIESMALQRLPSGERAHPWTPEMLKDFGKLTGISPVKAEAIIRGYTAAIGGAFLTVGDAMYRHATGATARPAATVNDMPGIGRFVRDGVNRTKYATRYYDFAREVNETVAVVDNYKRVGEIEMARKMATENMDSYKYKRFVSRVNSQLAKLTRLKKIIWADKSMTREEKRVKMDEIQKSENEIYQKAYRVIYEQKEK